VLPACAAIAGLSLLAPSAPTTDSWGWIVWGREVLHLDLSTVVPGPPSWKPLPVLLTTPLALAGGIAPTLWLFAARVGALLSLVAAAQLSRRLAGPWAAAIAVAGLVLCTDWLRAFAHGYTEPLAIGLLIAAAGRHLSGRPRHALALAALAALARPEALIMVALYGASQWRRGALRPGFVATTVAAVAALWIVPDWLGSGDPLHAAHVAGFTAPSGPRAALHALAGALLILPAPLLVTGLAGAAIAVRRGDGRVVWLALAVAVWVAVVTAMMAAGYPARPRFYMLPAGLWCVVGAVGAMWLAEAARGPGWRPAVALAAVLVALPAVLVRAEHSLLELADASTRARLESDLVAAVDRAAPALRACGGPMLPARLTWMKGAVAWRLDVPLRAVHAVRTAGTSGYLGRLSDPDNRPLPRLSADRTVTVSPSARGSAFLDPFANARLRIPGGERTVTADGPWRVVALRRPHDICPGRASARHYGPTRART
jgi:hypothetical protein